MPTYEYKCTGCGHTLELFQQMTAQPITACPQCSQHTLQRQIGKGAGIIFKGSGFYATDYRKGSPPKPEKAPAQQPSTDTSPASTPKETPPKDTRSSDAAT